MTTNEIKEQIIQNWILFEKHREPNRKELKAIRIYVEEDHVDEIGEGLGLKQDNIGAHVICQNCGASTNL